MKKRNLTVSALSALVGVHETAVFCWLRKEYEPSKKNAKKMIDIFKGELTFDDIYGN